jgi:hypothetical protein
VQDERWTPAKKRRQMLQLVRQLSAARSSHNEQVVALRQRKRDMVAQLNSMQARLAVVNGQLGVTCGFSVKGQTLLLNPPNLDPPAHLLSVLHQHVCFRPCVCATPQWGGAGG